MDRWISALQRDVDVRLVGSGVWSRMESSTGKFIENMARVSCFRSVGDSGDSITARRHDLLSEHSVLSRQQQQADDGHAFSPFTYYEETLFEEVNNNDNAS